MRIRSRQELHPAGSATLELSDVGVQYDGHVALQGVTLRVEGGERWAVVGPNGAGKSTLFGVIAGILRPASGSVRIHGSAPGRHVCIAYIEQQPDVDWRFPVTVSDVVSMGRIARGRTLGLLGGGDRAAVAEALERVGLTGLRHRQIGELSGGERRRMFIARAIAQEAELLLLDEPFSNLDAEARRQLLETLDHLDSNIAVLVATHDLDIADRLGRTLLLNRRIIAAGATGDVLATENLARAYGRSLRRVEGRGESYTLTDSHWHGAPKGQSGA